MRKKRSLNGFVVVALHRSWTTFRQADQNHGRHGWTEAIFYEPVELLQIQLCGI